MSGQTIFRGRVFSTKMDKTITVLVDRFYRHPIYNAKLIRSTKKFKAHDEHEVCKKGDIVEIHSCRPISKSKAFMFTRVLYAYPHIEGKEDDIIVYKQPSHAQKFENPYGLPFRHKSDLKGEKRARRNK